MDCSTPGSSIHGIFQARVLEWVAIAFSAYLTRVDPKSNNCPYKKSRETHAWREGRKKRGREEGDKERESYISNYFPIVTKGNYVFNT